MFIKQTCKKLKGKTYSNYLLVESVATPKGSPPPGGLLTRIAGSGAQRALA